jgi:small subunit ribosomal protein S18
MIKNPSHPKKGQIRTKECRFVKAGIEYIDYKDTETLLRFTNDQGKILPRRVTGTSAKFQRQFTRAVKRARHMALLPFVAENIR